MKVKVYHANNPTFGMGDAPKFPEEFTHVADVELPDLNDAQDVAYRLTNHIDTDWRENEEVTALSDKARSTSVGDVIQVGNEFFMVGMMGFEKIEVCDDDYDDGWYDECYPNG